VDSSLVLIPVHATSATGTSITDLVAPNFQVFEDGVEQKIAYFVKEDAPLSVGLLFDSSGSMMNKIHKSAQAAAAFFKTANASDEFFLVEFGERPKLQMPFTSDSDQIYRKIIHLRPFGRTSLIDAIHLALLQMKNARHPRKAIVILSDGGDNHRGPCLNQTFKCTRWVYSMAPGWANTLPRRRMDQVYSTNLPSKPAVTFIQSAILTIWNPSAPRLETPFATNTC
jgi:VWFA-related protein